MSIQSLNAASFSDFIAGPDPSLVDFYADWCAPCQQMGQVLEELAGAEPALPIGKVNIDDDPDLAAAYVVRSIPTLILYRNGEPAHRWTGVHPLEEIRSHLHTDPGEHFTAPEAPAMVQAEPAAPIPTDTTHLDAGYPPMPGTNAANPLSGMLYSTYPTAPWENLW